MKVDQVTRKDCFCSLISHSDPLSNKNEFFKLKKKLFLPEEDGEWESDPSNDNPRHEPIEVGLNLIPKVIKSNNDLFLNVNIKIIF